MKRIIGVAIATMVLCNVAFGQSLRACIPVASTPKPQGTSNVLSNIHIVGEVSRCAGQAAAAPRGQRANTFNSCAATSSSSTVRSAQAIGTLGAGR